MLSAYQLLVQANALDKSEWNYLILNRAINSGSIFLSVAFLEAAINEWYVDAARGLTSVHPASAKLANQLSSLGLFDRTSSLEKYQAALVICGHEPFKTGENPFQAAQAVIQLRNALIHFNPTWSPPGQSKPDRLDSILHAQVGENLGDPGEIFLEKYTTLRCARWAFRSCGNLVRAFGAQVGPMIAIEMKFLDKLLDDVPKE